MADSGGMNEHLLPKENDRLQGFALFKRIAREVWKDGVMWRLLAIVLLFLASALGNAIPAFSEWIVDDYLKSESLITKTMLSLFGMIFGMSVLTLVAQWLFYYDAENISANLKKEVIRKAIGERGKDIVAESSQQLKRVITSYLTGAVTNLTTFAVGLYSMIIFSPGLAAFAFTIMAIILVSDYTCIRPCIQTREEVVEDTVDQVNQTFADRRGHAWKAGLLYVFFSLFSTLSLLAVGITGIYMLKQENSKKTEEGDTKERAFTAFILYGCKVWYSLNVVAGLFASYEFGDLGRLFLLLDASVSSHKQIGTQETDEGQRGSVQPVEADPVEQIGKVQPGEEEQADPVEQIGKVQPGEEQQRQDTESQVDIDVMV